MPLHFPFPARLPFGSHFPLYVCVVLRVRLGARGMGLICGTKAALQVQFLECVLFVNVGVRAWKCDFRGRGGSIVRIENTKVCRNRKIERVEDTRRWRTCHRCKCPAHATQQHTGSPYLSARIPPNTVCDFIPCEQHTQCFYAAKKERAHPQLTPSTHRRTSHFRTSTVSLARVAAATRAAIAPGFFPRCRSQ
jgi:hypothetical protein